MHAADQVDLNDDQNGKWRQPRNMRCCYTVGKVQKAKRWTKKAWILVPSQNHRIYYKHEDDVGDNGNVEK